MDEDQERRRKIILKVVGNQIRDNDPPETRKTLKRLIKEGFSREEAVELIGTVVVHELYNVLKSLSDKSSSNSSGGESFSLPSSAALVPPRTGRSSSLFSSQ